MTPDRESSCPSRRPTTPGQQRPTTARQTLPVGRREKALAPCTGTARPRTRRLPVPRKGDRDVPVAKACRRRVCLDREVRALQDKRELPKLRLRIAELERLLRRDGRVLLGSARPGRRRSRRREEALAPRNEVGPPGLGAGGAPLQVWIEVWIEVWIDAWIEVWIEGNLRQSAPGRAHTQLADVRKGIRQCYGYV